MFVIDPCGFQRVLYRRIALVVDAAVIDPCGFQRVLY